MKTKPTALAFVGFGLLLAVLAIASPPVLPPNFNPPLPAYYTCQATGSGAICRAHRPDTLDQVPFGIICGTAQNPVELLLTGSDVYDLTRYYDTQGNLTRRVVREQLDATMTNPVTGLSAIVTQTGEFIDTLVVPGDFASTNTQQTGQVKFYLPGGGVLMRDVGRTLFDADDNLILESGQHQLDLYFSGDSSQAAALCAALGSPGTP